MTLPRTSGRRPSLVVQFGAVSLLLMVALGVAMGFRLRQVIERRNVGATAGMVTATVGFVARQQLDPAFGGSALIDLAKINQVQDSIRALDDTSEIGGLTAWVKPNLAVTFQKWEPTVVEQRPLPAAVLRTFEGGEPTRILSRSDAVAAGGMEARLAEEEDGRLLVVSLPIHIGDQAEPAVAVQALVSMNRTDAAIAADTRSMVGLLAGGLVVLYLALFRLVAGASRRLRDQSAANQAMALHDQLTGLPNRTLLRDRVEQAIVASARTGHHVALLLLDLDRFKEVNDTLGHHHGDLLLEQIGPRLRACLRDADTVARLGGDEFVVVLPTAASTGEVLAVAERLVLALAEPFALDSVSLDVEASIGVAYTPDHGDGFDDLLQRADVAMYVAKEARTGVSVYDPELDSHSTSRLTMLSDLRRAIEEPDQLVLHYQPKASLTTGTTVGVEALVRWMHPEHGMRPPADFIPAAERTGLIRQLTTRVLEDAVTQLRQWMDEGLGLHVAVNVSARCLLDAGFPARVAELLERHGVPASRLELELTESAIMTEPERSLAVLVELNAMGVMLSIDDFGTGYSSMAYLKRLPVHELKVDRTFVTSMHGDASDAAIVRSSVELGRNLGLRVVAEGVETEEVWQDLQDLGCDLAQGYFLARPMAADDVGPWLAAAGASRATGDAPVS